MLRLRIPATLAILVAALVGAAPASAKAPKRHPLHGTMTVTTLVSQKGAPPAPGSSCVDSGTVNVAPWGGGSLKVSSTFDWSPSPGSYMVHGTGQFVFKKSTLKFKFLMLATLQFDRRVFNVGTATITGGTGKLRHASGGFMFEGSSGAILSPAVMSVTGRFANRR